MDDERCFRLPDLGEGLTDAELVSWRVAVGDLVALNQVIAEVETAKAAVELPSPFAGRVARLHASEGDTVPVGAPIITFADADADAGTGTAERVPVLVGYGSTAGTSSRRVGRRPTPTPVPASSPAPAAFSVPSLPAVPSLAPAPTPANRATDSAQLDDAAPSALKGVTARPLAKPLVRKLARDRGVDLADVRGTGAGGVVTRQDVVDHLAEETPSSAPSGSPAEAGPSAERERRIPVRGVRRATAQAMVRSAFTAPQVTVFATVDVTPTVDLMQRLKDSTYLDGVRLTMLAFVAKAVVTAVGRHPDVNSSWDEEAQEIVLKHYVNLGIATATPRGLMVPVIRDADGLDLFALARALEQLTATAREGRATPSDLTGGTISITNVGIFGVDCGTPILNPGEAAILCLGAVRQQPWVHEGALAVRWVTTLGLTFDHRLVDGEQGSRFLADVAGALAAG